MLCLLHQMDLVATELLTLQQLASDGDKPPLVSSYTQAPAGALAPQLLYFTPGVAGMVLLQVAAVTCVVATKNSKHQSSVTDTVNSLSSCLALPSAVPGRQHNDQTACYTHGHA